MSVKQLTFWLVSFAVFGIGRADADDNIRAQLDAFRYAGTCEEAFQGPLSFRSVLRSLLNALKNEDWNTASRACERMAELKTPTFLNEHIARLRAMLKERREVTASGLGKDPEALRIKALLEEMLKYYESITPFSASQLSAIDKTRDKGAVTGGSGPGPNRPDSSTKSDKMAPASVPPTLLVPPDVEEDEEPAAKAKRHLRNIENILKGEVLPQPKKEIVIDKCVSFLDFPDNVLTRECTCVKDLIGGNSLGALTADELRGHLNTVSPHVQPLEHPCQDKLYRIFLLARKYYEDNRMQDLLEMVKTQFGSEPLVTSIDKTKWDRGMRSNTRFPSHVLRIFIAYIHGAAAIHTANKFDDLGNLPVQFELIVKELGDDPQLENFTCVNSKVTSAMVDELVREKGIEKLEIVTNYGRIDYSSLNGTVSRDSHFPEIERTTVTLQDLQDSERCIQFLERCVQAGSEEPVVTLSRLSIYSGRKKDVLRIALSGLMSERLEVRLASIAALSATGDELAIPHLLEVASADTSMMCREIALLSLCRFQVPRLDGELTLRSILDAIQDAEPQLATSVSIAQLYRAPLSASEIADQLQSALFKPKAAALIAVDSHNYVEHLKPLLMRIRDTDDWNGEHRKEIASLVDSGELKSIRGKEEAWESLVNSLVLCECKEIFLPKSSRKALYGAIVSEFVPTEFDYMPRTRFNGSPSVFMPRTPRTKREELQWLPKRLELLMDAINWEASRLEDRLRSIAAIQSSKGSTDILTHTDRVMLGRLKSILNTVLPRQLGHSNKGVATGQIDPSRAIRAWLAIDEKSVGLSEKRNIFKKQLHESSKEDAFELCVEALCGKINYRGEGFLVEFLDEITTEKTLAFEWLKENKKSNEIAGVLVRSLMTFRDHNLKSAIVQYLADNVDDIEPLINEMLLDPNDDLATTGYQISLESLRKRPFTSEYVASLGMNAATVEQILPRNFVRSGEVSFRNYLLESTDAEGEYLSLLNSASSEERFSGILGLVGCSDRESSRSALLNLANSTLDQRHADALIGLALTGVSTEEWRIQVANWIISDFSVRPDRTPEQLASLLIATRLLGLSKISPNWCTRFVNSHLESEVDTVKLCALFCARGCGFDVDKVVELALESSNADVRLSACTTLKLAKDIGESKLSALATKLETLLNEGNSDLDYQLAILDLLASYKTLPSGVLETIRNCRDYRKSAKVQGVITRCILLHTVKAIDRELLDSIATFSPAKISDEFAVQEWHESLLHILRLSFDSSFDVGLIGSLLMEQLYAIDSNEWHDDQQRTFGHEVGRRLAAVLAANEAFKSIYDEKINEKPLTNLEVW